MSQALDLARRAMDDGEVPIGCVVVEGGTPEEFGAGASGLARVVGRGWNQTERLEDPTAHAEMIAISAATSTLGYARLEGLRVFVTVEPCLMCAGALLLARVGEVIFGAREPKFGAIESRYRVLDVEGLNHYFTARGGVLADESAALLKGFFKDKRRGA